MAASLLFCGTAELPAEAAEVGQPVISILPEAEPAVPGTSGSGAAASPEDSSGSISLIEIGPDAAGSLESAPEAPVRAILRYPEPAV
jgi:hypothetical protein